MEIKTIFANHLYAFQYKGEANNEVRRLFLDWNDNEFLFNFFEDNSADLQSGFYGPISVEDAVLNTIKEAQLLEETIINYQNNKKFNFHKLFENNLSKIESPLKELIPKKAYGPYRKSWLRIYAIEVSNDCYIVTGGAIKLTLEMAQRSHTIRELDKMKMCLQYLKENGIYDNKGITETIEFD